MGTRPFPLYFWYHSAYCIEQANQLLKIDLKKSNGLSNY